VTAAQTNLEEVRAISQHMLSAICQDVCEYAALDESIKRDLITINIRTAQLFLEVVDRQRMPTDAQLEVLATAARERVHQGVPLAALLRAYRVGGHEMWKHLSQGRPDLDRYLLTDSILRYINWTSAAAEHAYTTERDDMLNSRLEATRLLLSRLVENDFESASARREAIRTLGLDSDRPHVAAIIGAASAVADPTTVAGTLIDVLHDVRRAMPTAVCALLRQGAVVVIPAMHTNGVSSLLRTAIRQRAPLADLLSIGIGRPGAGDGGLLTTVQEAERARALGEILFPGRSIHEYDTVRFYDLFRHGEVVDEFVDSVLADLARHDQGSRGELIRTLHTYFTLGMNRRAAATRLGIHPNTLDYRLRKAGMVCAIEVTNPETSFRFQLAVRLLPICSKKSWLTGKMLDAD
jgi:sugar diacid utilization regulator